MDEATNSLVQWNKLALVVGVNNSSNTPIYRAALRYAEKDAEDVAYLLRQPQCGFTLSTSPLLGEKATSVAIKHSLIALSKERKNLDFLLFYFSGHAAPVKDDIYLVTSDFEDSDVEEDASMHLSMRWLWNKLYQSSSAGCVLIILDCCYAGNIVETQDDPYKIDLRKLLDKWSGDSSENLLHNKTRHILTATGYDIKAQELDEHGLMTGLLILALQGEVDEALDREGNVEIGLLYSYLKGKMPEKQKPDLSGKFGPYNCILASHPHRSVRVRQQSEENEVKKAFEKGILHELFRLHAETQHTQPFDHSVCHGASLNEIDWEKVTEFLKQERTQQEDAFQLDISIHDQLMQFGFLQEAFPTYGMLLCFGQAPSKWVAGAVTRCIDWEGSANMDRMQDSREYRGSLLAQFELSLNFLKKKLRLRRVIGREGREEEWEIPLAVVEEALANALVHREYPNRTDPVRVEVFDDRLEICSPGILPPPMTEDLLRVKHKSYPRNPQVAGIFYLHGYIEKLGSGIQRMQQFMKNNNLAEPKFVLGEDRTFTVILYRPEQEGSHVQSNKETVVSEQPLPIGIERANPDQGRLTITDSFRRRARSTMGYVTLDITITPSTTESNAYKVDASIKGISNIPKLRRTASEEISINLQEWRDLNDTLESLKIPGVRSNSYNEDTQAKEFGESLFQQVITGTVYTLYRNGKDYCNNRGRILRLRLHLGSPELIELPWEFLYEERSFLGLARILIIRCPVDVKPVRAVEHHLPLQIMLMTAEPIGHPADAKREKDDIKEALKDAEDEGRVSLKEVPGSDVELANIYKNKTLDIFHFIGRGSINEATREGELILEDVRGNARTISADKFSRSLPNSVKLVFLNAREVPRGNAHEPFSNIAYILAKQGYAVIAMQFQISVNAAAHFADIFYSEIAKRTPVGEAVAEARQRVFTMLDCNPLDWAAPVLYMKSDNGVLFDIKDPSPSVTLEDDDEPVADVTEESLTISNNAATHCKTGNALLELKRYQEAVEAYEQAIHLESNHVDAYNGKGNALLELKRYQEAVEAYEQAIRLDSKNVDAYNGKGNVLLELKRYQEAVEAYNRKGNALLELKRYQETVEAYEQAIRLDPTYVDSHNGKGNALLELKRYQEAVEAYEQAIRLDPKNVDAYKGKGNALSSLRHYREALLAYQRVVELNPKDKEAQRAYQRAARLSNRTSGRT